MRILIFILSLFLLSSLSALQLSQLNNNSTLKLKPNIVVPNKIVSTVDTTVATERHTAYKLGGHEFNPSQGQYVVDCSTYVSDVLKRSAPTAYESLVNNEDSDAPTSLHYYDFFNKLSYENNPYWTKVSDVQQLKPGDILVFRDKPYVHASVRGHVMVVMSKPVAASNAAYEVRVADSAPAAHTNDTRSISHHSGIGIGTMELKADSETGKPDAYAWKVGSPWKNNVNIAMARPASVLA